MISGKPVTVQPDYKWGVADALGIGDENDVYLVTTGLGDEMNRAVAEKTALALNLHDEMLEALKGLIEQRQLTPKRVSEASHLWDAVLEVIAKAEGRT